MRCSKEIINLGFHTLFTYFVSIRIRSSKLMPPLQILIRLHFDGLVGFLSWIFRNAIVPSVVCTTILFTKNFLPFYILNMKCFKGL